MMHLTFDLVRVASWLAGCGFHELWETTEEETQQVIIDSDVDTARKIVARNEKLFKTMLEAYRGVTYAKAAYRCAMEGMKIMVPEPENIEGNWHLPDWDHATSRRFGDLAVIRKVV
jgi:hypothetical protein